MSYLYYYNKPPLSMLQILLSYFFYSSSMLNVMNAPKCILFTFKAYLSLKVYFLFCSFIFFFFFLSFFFFTYNFSKNFLVYKVLIFLYCKDFLFNSYRNLSKYKSACLMLMVQLIMMSQELYLNMLLKKYSD